MDQLNQSFSKSFVDAMAQQLSEGLEKIQHCVKQLDRDQLWWRPIPTMNSVANLLIHLNGNLKQWIITGLTDLPDQRTRQAEFDDRSMRQADELLTKLAKTIHQAVEIMQQQSAEELARTRSVQEWDLSGFQAIAGAVCHFHGHVQEIVHMTRCQLGERYMFDFVPRDV